MDFATAVLTHPEFAAGRLSTGFVAEHFENGETRIAPPAERLRLMALAATIVYHNRQNLTRESLKPMAALVGASRELRDCHPYMVRCGDEVFDICLRHEATPTQWTVTVNGMQHGVVTPPFEFYRRRLKLTVDGEPHMFRLYYQYSFFGVAFGGTLRVFKVFSPREWELASHMPAHREQALENVLLCPMPGLVVTVRVQKRPGAHPPGSRCASGCAGAWERLRRGSRRDGACAGLRKRSRRAAGCRLGNAPCWRLDGQGKDAAMIFPRIQMLNPK